MSRTALLFLLAAMIAVPSIGLAKVRAVSTDGEATVYLTHDFTRAFDVSYEVHFAPSAENRSSTFVSILLLERTSGSRSIGVGLSRGSPRENRLSGFVDVTRPKAAAAYRSVPVRCTMECYLELRGTPGAVTALIDHRAVGTWARKSLGLTNPYIQINGEVSAVGDKISAQLTPVLARIGNIQLPRPTCAFTTQGVHAEMSAAGQLAFKGKRDTHAGATYVSLLTGATGDTCREANAERIR